MNVPLRLMGVFACCWALAISGCKDSATESQIDGPSQRPSADQFSNGQVVEFTGTFIECLDSGGLIIRDTSPEGRFSLQCGLSDIPTWQAVSKGTEVKFRGKVHRITYATRQGGQIRKLTQNTIKVSKLTSPAIKQSMLDSKQVAIVTALQTAESTWANTGGSETDRGDLDLELFALILRPGEADVPALIRKWADVSSSGGYKYRAGAALVLNQAGAEAVAFAPQLFSALAHDRNANVTTGATKALLALPPEKTFPSIIATLETEDEIPENARDFLEKHWQVYDSHFLELFNRGIPASLKVRRSIALLTPKGSASVDGAIAVLLDALDEGDDADTTKLLLRRIRHIGKGNNVASARILERILKPGKEGVRAEALELLKDINPSLLIAANNILRAFGESTGQRSFSKLPPLRFPRRERWATPEVDKVLASAAAEKVTSDNDEIRLNAAKILAWFFPDAPEARPAAAVLCENAELEVKSQQHAASYARLLQTLHPDPKLAAPTYLFLLKQVRHNPDGIAAVSDAIADLGTEASLAAPDLLVELLANGVDIGRSDRWSKNTIRRAQDAVEKALHSMAGTRKDRVDEAAPESSYDAADGSVFLIDYSIDEEMRTWTDKTGKFSVKAAFLYCRTSFSFDVERKVEAEVALWTAKGKTITVSAEKFKATDIASTFTAFLLAADRAEAIKRAGGRKPEYWRTYRARYTPSKSD